MASIGQFVQKTKSLARILSGEGLALSTGSRYSLAIAIYAGAVAARFVMPIDGGLVYITFYPAVAVSALLCGTGPCLLTLALSSVTSIYAFMPPFGAFKLVFDQLIAVSFFLVAGGIICFMTSRLQRYAAEMRGSENKLRGLYELSPLGIALTDMNGRYIEFNKAFQDICGYSAEELKTLDYWTLTPKKYAADEALQLTAMQRTGHYGPYEKEYVRKDGATIPLRLNGMLITDVDDRQYIWSIVEDITDRRLAEQKLKLAASVFANSIEGIMITGTDSRIIDVNDAFTDITGYSANEVIGKTPHMLRSGRHDDAFYQAMRQTLGRTGAWQGEIWNRRKNGEVYPEWLSITTVKDDSGAITSYVGTMIDISQRKAAEDEIKYLAYYDSLTRLPNRRLLKDRLEQAMALSARSGQRGALLFVDLDNFKTLNDTLGHDKGDLLLEQVARRLIGCVREGDSVARFGGDEFVILLENLSHTQDEAARQTRSVGEKIRAALNEPYQLGSQGHHGSSSIGATLFHGHTDSVEELLKQADLAMYQAKAAGRNVMRFFDQAMQAVANARAVLEADFRQGLRRNEFVLYYQPQVDGDGRMIGVEALVRWQHPARGLVSPDEFIPLAEETGLILQLGHWVLETACAQLVAWANHPAWAHLTLAVNTSVRQFRHADFTEQVLAVIDETGANPMNLKLEITESLLMDDVEDIIAKMTVLKARGVGFSLDDFGTGYSSLTYLKRLPLDQLKIDRSFVRDILSNHNDAVIARTIVALARSLGLAVIAEGVETRAQRDFLASEGCHAYQGYLFGRPGPAETIEQYLNRG